MTHKLTRLTALMLAIVMTVSMLLIPVEAASFRDVSDNAWYSAAVDYVHENGWMAGVSETSFAPNLEVTRGMFVTVLARYAQAETDNGNSAFTDTPAGSWFTGAAAWAAEQGLASGVGGGKFAPNRVITRQDLCAILYKYIEKQELTLAAENERSFTDFDAVSDYARDAVSYCAAAGLVAGYDDGSFHPTDTATRAQLAAILMRLDLLVKGEEAPTEPMPAQSFEGGEESAMTVNVEAPEGALPENTQMTVKPVTNKASLAVIESQVNGDVLAAADIVFSKDDAKIEPAAEVEVQIGMEGLEELQNPMVVHVKEDCTVEYVNAALVSINRSGSEKALRFMAKDFSVYAVVDGDTNNDSSRLVVKIWKRNPSNTAYVVDKEILVTRQDVNRLASIIPDGETPTATGKEIFCGWYLDTQSFNGGANEPRYTTEDVDGRHTMDKVREDIRALLEDPSFVISDSDTTVHVYPMIYNYFVTTLVDENGETTFDTNVIFTKESTASYTPNYVYTPYVGGYRFIGWQKDDGDPTVYANGESANLTEQTTVFRAQVQKGYWLSFNENPDNNHSGASYSPPVFCVDGAVSSSDRPNNPTLPGYNFDGWYTDQSYTTKFNFNQTIEADTTVYAHWTAKTKVGYTVIVWRQSVEDLKTYTDAQKTYDYAFSYTVPDSQGVAPGTAVSSLDLSYYKTTHSYTDSDGDTHENQINTQPDGNGSWYSFYGFKYNNTQTAKSGSGDVSIGGGVVANSSTVNIAGNTVINLYWDRELIEITFYTKPYIAYTGTNSSSLLNSSSTIYYIKHNTYGYCPIRYYSSSYQAIYIPTTDSYSTTSTQCGIVDGTWYELIWRQHSTTGEYYWAYKINTTYYRYGDVRYKYYTYGSYTNYYWYYIGDWTERDTYTGLYGQRLKYAGYTWPTDYRWYTAIGGTSFISILDTFSFSQNENPTNNNHTDFYGYSENFDTKVYHFLMDEDGNWPSTAEYPIPTIVGNGMTFRSFQGFSVYQFRVALPSGVTSYQTATEISEDTSGDDPVYTLVNPETHTPTNGWTDWLDYGTYLDYDGNDRYENWRWNATEGGIEFRYSRNKYRIQYMVGGYYNDKGERISGPVTGLLKRTGAIYYEKNISSYANYYTDPTPDIHSDEFVFDNWYIDPTCTQPYTFTSTTTMPLNGLTLYAKFVQKEYRVFVHPNIPAALPAANVVWPNGVKTNMKVDYMDMVEGGNEIVIRDSREDPEWELIGWYTDAACTQLYNFETRLTDETVVDYDQTDVTDTGPYTATDGVVWGRNGTGFNKDAAEHRFWVTGKLELYAKWRRRFPGANGIHVDYHAVENQDETGKFTELEQQPIDWTDPLAYTADAWVIARSASTPDAPEDYQFLYWQILGQNGEPYVLEDGETLDPAKLIYPGQGFRLSADDAEMSTIQNAVTEHQHSLEHYPASSATATCMDGNSEYWYCAACGKYFSDANANTETSYSAVLIPGDSNQHQFSDYISNNDGTHSKTCSRCGTRITTDCSFEHVETPPTTTSQGYTTHTCTVCGYSYVDSYTDPVQTTYTVTATVSGGHGSVSPDSATVVETQGTSFTAAPDEDYMLSNVTVAPSDAAEISFVGDIVTVSNVTADCTVTLSFAPSQSYTVIYMANGSELDRETVVKNDTVTLPDSAPTPSGCSFLGWVKAAVPATTQEQSGVLAAGAVSGAITADTTFYALYSFERSAPVTAYELLTAAPDDWTGKYVITYLTTTSLYAVKGLSGNTNYESTSAGAVAYASTGMTRFTQDGKTYLRDVSNDYVFTAAARTGGYSLQNVAASTYLGSYNNSLYSRGSYSASYCVWSLDYDSSNNCMVVSNSASSSYPYLVKGSSYYFVVNSSYTGNRTQFWKETTVNTRTTYYSTTTDANYTVTAVSNNNAYGSVTPGSASVSNGDSVTFTAAPAEGYTYASPACTVTEGTATVSQNGSDFTVTPSSNCTLTVNFAPKTYTVNAQVDTASHGTVSVSGSPVTHGGSATVTFTPASGYTLADPAYTLTGNGTVTQEGNTFTVTPAEDCTLTVNTMAQYTVTYMVNGAVNSTASVAAGGSVTLPFASIDGYTFLGWSETSYGPTTAEPEESALLSGDYTPSGNVTLYAAFTYSEGGTPTTAYKSYDGITDWTGNWVITYLTSNSVSGLYFLKGLSGNTNYESSSAGGAAVYSTVGASYDGDLSALYNVPNAYVWTAAEVNGKYTLKNVSTGTYLASYNEYLYSRSTYNANYCLWTLSNDGNGTDTASNSADENYPYLNFNTSSKYFRISSSNSSNLWFWRQETVNIGGTIYYATELDGSNASHTVTYQTANPGSGTAAVTEPAEQLLPEKSQYPAANVAAAAVPVTQAASLGAFDGMAAELEMEEITAVEAAPKETQERPVSPYAQPAPVQSVAPVNPVTATTDKYEIVTSFEDGGVYIIGYTNTNNNYVYVVTTNEYDSDYGMILPTRVTRTLGSDGYYTFSSDIASYQWTAANTTGSYYSLYNSASDTYLGSYYYNYNSTLYVALMDGGMNWRYDSTNRYLYNYRSSTPSGNKYLYFEDSGTSYGTYGYFTFVTSTYSADPFTLYKLVPQTAPTTYTVTADPGDHGSVSSANPVTVNANGTATFTIQPDDGYEIESVRLNNSNGAASFSDNTVTVSNVTGNCTVTVTYKVAGSYYVWKPVDDIQEETPYLIGFIVNGTVYLAVNYNESANSYYYSRNSNYYGYTAIAEMDETHPDYVKSVRGNATDFLYCVWEFSGSQNGTWAITSGSDSDYYLRTDSSTSYADLYPGKSSTYGSGWTWNSGENTLSRVVGTTTRYAQYYSYNSGNYMSVISNKPTNGSVQLYSRVLITPATTYTVTFADSLDENNTVEVEVEEGQGVPTDQVPNPDDPASPFNHEDQHYYFIGWNREYDNVTGDITVTALYEYRQDGYYTVTFRDWNGAILQVNGQNTQIVAEGRNAVAPAIPTRTGYYFKSWDKDLRNVTQNMTVYATYASIVTKLYTVNLKAVYGPVVPLEKTHVNWYANNDTNGSMESEKVTINENINIQSLTSYRDSADGSVLKNDGYTFLGWARMPEYVKMEHEGRDYVHDGSEDPILGARILQYNDLTDQDLWLVYNEADKEHPDPYFTVREEGALLNGGAAFQHIAANENDPYHGLYAVWKRDVFYVMHSSNGDLEAVGMPVDNSETGLAVDGLSYKVGTFDLTSLVRDGNLYGGYYSVYGGADDAAVTRAAQSFTFAGQRGWVASSLSQVEAVHSVNTWTGSNSFLFTAYNGDYSFVSANGTVTNKPVYEKDETGRPVLISSRFWTAANAYSTAIGTAMRPTAGEVYYLKEVPDAYLRSRIAYVKNTGDTEVVNNYLLSYVDDNLYRNIGFKYAPGDSIKYTRSQQLSRYDHLTSTFTLETNGAGNSSVVINNDTFGLEHGLVSVKDVSALLENEEMTMIPMWQTYDGVLVENDPMYLYVEGNSISCLRNFPDVLYVDMNGALGWDGNSMDWLEAGAVPYVYFCNDEEEMQVFVELVQVGDSSIYMADIPRNVQIKTINIIRMNPAYDEPVWTNPDCIWTQTNDIAFNWTAANDCLTSFKASRSDASWGAYTP